MSITYYNSKHDISYSKFNASNIPWNINTSYIYQNNLNTRNVSQYFQNINNNLLFESSTNNIIFITPQNKNVIVKNNMVIHNNLDISNNLNTSLTRANDISVNNVLYFSDISPNVVGTLKVQGGIFINSNKEDKEASRTRFTGIVLYGTVIIFDCSIVDCDNIITTDISDSSIINSYIYNTPIGYDKYNNIYPNNAIFSDVILNNLIFDSSLNNNRLSFIRFNNNSNSNSITISSSNDFSNLEISKPLLVEQQETNTNIINVSNISIFNGDISCNTLYYSRLNPDIRLNTYFDVSVSAFSLSGSIIPTRSTNIDLGSNTSKFRNIHSDKFTGVLDGSSTIALNLVPNLSMSFNDLNITGALTLNGLNLNQNLITNFVTISNVNISFGAITSNISDLSLNLNSRITILRNNITLSFGDVSSNIRTICGTLISISNDIFYTKTGFDTSLNRNFIKNTDLSTAIMVNPDAIYGSIGYLDNALNKQISVTLSNELLFPYAITYIDDNVEDTNIKERYKIKQTMTKSTTTLTTAYTVKTIRTFKTTPNYNNVPAEPDNANNSYLVMDNISSSDINKKRKWYDSNGSESLPAVFKKTVDAVPSTIVTSFELRTNADTWTNHKRFAEEESIANVRTVSLAIIANQEDNNKIKDLLPVNSAAWIGAQRIKPWSNTDLATGGSVTNDDTYIYHTFTSSGTFTSKFNGNIEVLLVGGGGGGGTARGYVAGTHTLRHGVGGGGGGGGVVHLTRVTVAKQAYNIGVGDGGPVGSNGTSSTAFNATAAGGGRGGGPGTTDNFQTLVAGIKGENGGSGGGAGYTGSDTGSTYSGGTGNITNIKGSNNTGDLYWGNGAATYYPWGSHRASGGGGAGGHAPTVMGPVATNSSSPVGTFGAGGMGINIPFLPSPSRTVWGGGGGGGTIKSGWQGGSVDPNGGGGAGGGAISTNPTPNGGSNGIANSGGGGGGGGGGDRFSDKPAGVGGAGGSGIVIIRYLRSLANLGGSEYWKWINDAAPWDNYINWAAAEPGLDESYAKIQKDGFWHDVNSNHNEIAVYMKKETIPEVPASNTLHFESEPRTWNEHIEWRTNNSVNSITYKFAWITSYNENEAIAGAAGNNPKIYIGGKRKTSSTATGTSGRSNNTWEWVDATTAWSYNNFYDGDSSISSYTTKYTQGIPGDPVNTTDLNGIPAVSTSTPVETYSDITQTNVKLPHLVSSSNGSIVVTSTAIGVNSRPTPPSGYREPANDVDNTPVSGFRPNDANVIGTIGTIGATVNAGVVNTIEVSTYKLNITGATPISGTNEYRLPSTTLDYATDTQDIYEYKRFIKHTYDTYVYRNDYYDTDNGLTAGSFKISDNSSNYSYYRTPAIAPPAAISTAAYVCIAITNDGMFVAIGKAYDVTVYMKVSNGWSSLGYIGVDFSTYINSNMIPTQLPPDFRKNIQNLAINYIAPTLFIAYGDNKTSIKVYRYTIAGQSWTPIGQAHIHNPTTNQLSNTNNFGYFVVLSFSPSILGFTVDDKFHTYNCSGASDNSIRGSSQTLTQPSTYNVDRNIIAFKISSDADKIIVSNTSYVFIYKWNITRGDWDVATYIDYARDVITFDYGTNKNIRAWPRSLDISNISSNECVFAIGFPDKHIYSPKGTLSTPATPSRARGYVEYWKLSNTTLTKLATLFPRMRDITTNTPGDIDEYFFSAGGIKITNSNTILVAPNYKFHFNSTNKSYYMSGITATQQYHFDTVDTGNNLAAIENEVENELIRVSARNHSNTSYYTGGKWTGSNWSWWTRESPSPFIWNFEAWDNYQPQFTSSAAVEVNTLSREWNSLYNRELRYAMYMTIMPSYSLNTFSIFNNKFFFHSSGFYSSYSTTNQSNTTIASWRISAESERIRFLANGDVQQSNNTRTTISDIRLKENIVDTRPKLQDLLKIRVVNYNLKGNKGNKLIGVVAQELEDIFPLLVGKQELSQEDIKLGKTETYKYVKYSCFDVMLIKAIQEQQTIITNLTSQLDLIDNKCKILKTISQDIVNLNQDRDFLICENELLKISINKILELMKKGTK